VSWFVPRPYPFLNLLYINIIKYLPLPRWLTDIIYHPILPRLLTFCMHLQLFAVQQARTVFLKFTTFRLGHSLHVQFSSDCFENMLIRIELKIPSQWGSSIFDAINK
jgi:hypothetical protein